LQHGWTALMLASQFGQIDVVRHLVQCGKASVNVRDNVSVCTIINKFYYVSQSLCDVWCMMDDVVWVWCMMYDVWCMTHLSLITVCAVQIQCGRTALHYAADGNMTVVKYLVEECQAVIITQDKDRKTPISCAQRRRYTNIVHYLKAQVMMKMVRESNKLPFYRGVRGIIVKYLQYQ